MNVNSRNHLSFASFLCYNVGKVQVFTAFF